MYEFIAIVIQIVKFVIILLFSLFKRRTFYYLKLCIQYTINLSKLSLRVQRRNI